MVFDSLQIVREFFAPTAAALCGRTPPMPAPTDGGTVIALDTLVEGVHFPADSGPADLAYRSLAVNLSDLAAMGAEPLAALVALVVPNAESAWLESFARGLYETAASCRLSVEGVWVAQGPRSVSAQVFGQVAHGSALRRSGARPGDDIWVSGSLGDAALALRLQAGELEVDALARRYLLERLERPVPRLALGRALRGAATSAIDVSDGLVADLGHILQASGVGATVTVDRLPLSPVFRSLNGAGSGWELSLAGGDDYELCFTVPAGWTAAGLETPVTLIGTVEATPGLRLRLSDGTPYVLQRGGYDHFAGDGQIHD